MEDFDMILTTEERAIIALYRAAKKSSLTEERTNPPAIIIEPYRLSVNIIGKGVIRLTSCDQSSYPKEEILAD